MWSPTAVRPSAPPWGQAAQLRKCWSGRHEGQLASNPVHLIPDRDASKPAGNQRTIGQRFGWSKACLVGLGGLEPPTSSLSAIEGSALCGPAFSQVTADRQTRSNAFLEGRPEGQGERQSLCGHLHYRISCSHRSDLTSYRDGFLTSWATYRPRLPSVRDAASGLACDLTQRGCLRWSGCL